ncbi:MAG: hypothetical protein ACRD1R_21660 [Acidobacteriota bacterium]
MACNIRTTADGQPYFVMEYVEGIPIDQFCRVRRGIEEIPDPLTGETFEVSSSSSYYWIDQRGRIAGTKVHGAPNIDFRQTIRIKLVSIRKRKKT